MHGDSHMFCGSAPHKPREEHIRSVNCDKSLRCARFSQRKLITSGKGEINVLLGLPISTFFWIIGVWIIAAVTAVIYGFTYRNNDDWWTLEDLFAKLKRNRGR